MKIVPIDANTDSLRQNLIESLETLLEKARNNQVETIQMGLLLNDGTLNTLSYSTLADSRSVTLKQIGMLEVLKNDLMEKYYG